MSPKEAQARIKINKLLEAAGWRFFDEVTGKANIALKPNVKLQQAQVDAMGHDFDTTRNGLIDFLLLDDHGFPLVVLEAKAERKKAEQAIAAANRELIRRFEVKIKASIDRVWGTGAN